MEDITELVTKLRSYHAHLAWRERTDGYAHDVVEAIEYWCSLAERGLANDKRVNYPERTDGETRWITKLENAARSRTRKEIAEYEQVFQAGRQLLQQLRRIPLPPDGYLGVLKAIRDDFGFLQDEYGFRVVDEQPNGMKFASDSVYIHLQHAKKSSLSCSFGRARERSSFYLEDLLYMHGDERYRAVPDEPALDTEAAVARWFAFVAEVLRTFGGGVLRGEDTAYTRLAEAQKQRDKEYVQRMERLYGSLKRYD